LTNTILSQPHLIGASCHHRCSVYTEVPKSTLIIPATISTVRFSPSFYFDLLL